MKFLVSNASKPERVEIALNFYFVHFSLSDDNDNFSSSSVVRNGHERAVTGFLNKKQSTFHLVSKVIQTQSGMALYCFATHCDWFKNGRATYSTKHIQNKNQSRPATRVFPRFSPVAYICYELLLHKFIALSLLLLIGHCFNDFRFGFKTQVKKHF